MGVQQGPPSMWPPSWFQSVIGAWLKAWRQEPAAALAESGLKRLRLL